MHLNKEEVRQKCQEAWMDNKEPLNKPKHRKEACRGWKQNQVTWEEYRGVVWAARHQARKGRALRELNFDRDIKGNKKNCTLVVKERLGKMWALSRRDQDTWLPRIWRRFLLNDFFASVLTSKCCSHTAQVTEQKGKKWRNEENCRKITDLRPSKEPEGDQVHDIQWDASVGPEGTDGWSG